MNIAFLAPGVLQRFGGGITDISHANYLIPAHDRKPKQGQNTIMRIILNKFATESQRPQRYDSRGKLLIYTAKVSAPLSLCGLWDKYFATEAQRTQRGRKYHISSPLCLCGFTRISNFPRVG